MTYPGEERRSTCDRCDVLRVDYAKNFAKLFAHLEDQISRNEACDQQLKQHEREISTMKEHKIECVTKVLPNMKQNITRVLVSVGGVGTLFVILMFIIQDVKSEAIARTSENRKSVEEVQKQANHNTNANNITNNNMVHITRLLEDQHKYSKEMFAELKTLIEKTNR